ncbi:Protein lin-28-like protein [Lucilia cuprina]|uniref:Protein lin-28-like protein n=1 Tax=Lucilia cuprina TaxID=7375 RepID=A0A0L0BTU7_LUCCU|nr:Protein lin-28 like protein [Lucilia cuprina]KNC23505.1 Protein lin-28-like protein [Lucilia cuprina]
MINSNNQTNMENDNGAAANNFDDSTLQQNTMGSNRPPIEPYETEGVRYGKCKWFNVAKGWGFITPNDGGQEVFVHQSVIQMTGFRSLGEQEDVEFECHLTERGLEATRVSGSHGSDCHGSTFRPRTKKRHRRVRCYNCGEFANHIASKCHLGPQPKRCHLCKQDDHLFANCPTKQNSSNNSQQHSSKDEHSFNSENEANNQPGEGR